MKKAASNLPSIVSRAVWEKHHQKILRKEKSATRARDALAAERRRGPMVLIEKDYVFRGPDGSVSLLDLFEGRSQLIVYHFMYAPDVHGWPDAGCPGCSMVVDQLAPLTHLNARNTSFALISVGPLKKLLRYKKRMGWNVPWVSSEGTSFNQDFGLTTPDGENFGLSVFIRDGKKIYQTYFTNGRGVEMLGSVWSLLDLTPLGRQETWEDTPAGRQQTEPYRWWRRHDEY